MKKILNLLKTKKKLSFIIGLSLLLVLILLITVKKESYASGSTYEVAMRTVSDSIELAGVVDVDNCVDLGFAASGRVKDILVKEGESVRRGQVIAALEQNNLGAQLLSAQANQVIVNTDSQSTLVSSADDYEAERLRQDALVEGAYQEYLSGDLQAYLQDDLSKSVTPPTVSGSYLGTQDGSYLLDVYGSNSDSGYSFRLSGLETGVQTVFTNQPGPLGSRGLYIKFSSTENYRNTSWIIPVPNYRSATYTSRKAAYENALATRERTLTSLANELGRVTSGSNGVSRSQALSNQARAQVNAVYAELGNGKITAPFDGIIAKNNLELGQVASAYTSYITLIGDRDMKLELNVPEIYINKIATGDEVTIVLDAYPDVTWKGTVQDIDIIDTVVDGVPVYQTTVAIDTNDDRIRIGMNAKAHVVAEARENVVAIPKHYLVEDSSGARVYLLPRLGSSPELVPVSVGFEGNDGFVEIVDGLEPGTIIVRPDAVRS